MPKCQSCGSQIAIESRFCSACGTPVPSDEVATVISSEAATIAAGPGIPRSRPGSSSGRNPSSVHGEGRFLPGAILAERYRIISLLGKGGMGEVYRADDLTLGQPVALKFLPEPAGNDPELLERFRTEVRISRKVSHPNVCRVYDVGEVDGLTFYAMEYIDGEDLASLLRRIGRLPSDKGLEIARQLCAGLAAAHAKGVLHRDLKPANIMLDGRGQVVVMDFGLAAFVDEITGADVRSGTPAFMAPEQLAGKEVTEKSDIYSLGLVLYEIFTGKSAYSADNLADLIKTRNAGAPLSRPSTIVKDIDPLVERVILRCLELEPANRPASVLTVAAALPGGDPLAAALAAGETPSPQMVAAAGQTEGMKPLYAVICLVLAVVGLGAGVWLVIASNAYEKMTLELPPEALSATARDVISRLGYDPRTTDHASDFVEDHDFLLYVGDHDKPRAQWTQIYAQRPTPLLYYYRTSPRYMVPSDYHLNFTPGIVKSDDPPPILSGMMTVWLDPQGHLLGFHAIPPEFDSSPPATKPVDWSPLFELAGLDMSKLQPAEPQWSSLANSDTRAAWTGTWPGSNRPLRIEAAAWRGKPVFFNTIGDWTHAYRMQPYHYAPGDKARQVVFIIIFLFLLTAAGLLARLNYRRGKGDRQGSFRIALVVFVLQMLLWVCYEHFVPVVGTVGLLILAVSSSLFLAGMVWTLYMALEPYVRKFWPQTIISWTRLLSGKLRDPLVGRDVLIGVLLGLSWIVIFGSANQLLLRLGEPYSLPSTDYLIGGRMALGATLFRVPSAIQATLLFFAMLLVLRIVLRNQWVAAAAFVAVWTILKVLGSKHPGIEILTEVLIYGIAALSIVRFGLVTLAVAVFVTDSLGNVPMTSDFSRWYATTALFVPAVILVLTVWAFYAALGGQKLIKSDLLE
jgi:predicted Ser/Thr protein kinase